MPGRALIAACGCLAFLSACSSGGSGSSNASSTAFLAEVHAAVPDISAFRSDRALIGLGHAACDDFASGAGYQQLADRLSLEEGSNRLPAQDLGEVVTAAADNFCPRYRGLVSGS